MYPATVTSVPSPIVPPFFDSNSFKGSRSVGTDRPDPLLLHTEKSSYLREISQAVTDGVESVYGSLVDLVRDALKLKESTFADTAYCG